MSKVRLGPQFNIAALEKNLPELITWPARLIVKIACEVNQDHVDEDLRELKSINDFFMSYKTKDTLDSEIQEIIDQTVEIWLIDKTFVGTQDEQVEKKIRNDMVFIVASIQDNKKFVFELIEKLLNKKNDVQKFESLMNQYAMLSFALLLYTETIRKKIFIGTHDFIDQLYHFFYSSPTKFHLSCISFDYVLESEFNYYKINRNKENNGKWALESRYDIGLISDIEAINNHVENDNKWYCFDGSNLDHENFELILLGQIFVIADELLGVHRKIINAFKQLPKNLAVGAIRNPDEFVKILNKINLQGEFAKKFLSNESLADSYRSMKDMLSNIVDKMPDLGKVQLEIEKKEKLFPHEEELYFKAFEELEDLHTSFLELSKNNKENITINTLEGVIEYFNDHKKAQYEVICDIDPQLIFYSKKHPDGDFILSENWTRDVRQKVTIELRKP
ncbi:MAG: hypothetical protein HQK65_10205 [Desulfamplus sp.]|nr:hypothetical protein [Desulfamplus sp.]